MAPSNCWEVNKRDFQENLRLLVLPFPEYTTDYAKHSQRMNWRSKFYLGCPMPSGINSVIPQGLSAVRYFRTHGGSRYLRNFLKEGSWEDNPFDQGQVSTVPQTQFPPSPLAEIMSYTRFFPPVSAVSAWCLCVSAGLSLSKFVLLGIAAGRPALLTSAPKRSWWMSFHASNSKLKRAKKQAA